MSPLRQYFVGVYSKYKNLRSRYVDVRDTSDLKSDLVIKINNICDELDRLNAELAEESKGMFEVTWKRVEV